MTDYTLEQIVAKARDARDGGEAAVPVAAKVIRDEAPEGR